MDSATVIQNVIRFRPVTGRLSLPDLCCDITIVGDLIRFTGPMSVATLSPYVDEDVLLLRINVLAARRLIGIPLCEVLDRVLELDDLSPSLCRMAAIAIDKGQPQAFMRSERLAVDARFAAAARALCRGVAVRSVAAMVGLSERQLERLLVDHAGVTPKLFQRVARFRQAAVAARAGVPLREVAAASGYADQSHFARDVNAFAGRAWRSLRGNFGDVGNVQAAGGIACLGCE